MINGTILPAVDNCEKNIRWGHEGWVFAGIDEMKEGRKT
jgi:hypothetical protein